MMIGSKDSGSRIVTSADYQIRSNQDSLGRISGVETLGLPCRGSQFQGTSHPKDPDRGDLDDELKRCLNPYDYLEPRT
jgi:hypothetical protein